MGIKSEESLVLDKNIQNVIFNQTTGKEDKVEEKYIKYFEKGPAKKSKAVKGNSEAKYADKIATTSQSKQLVRLQHFRKQCKLYKFDENSFNSSEVLTVLYSEKYKLAYKQVPKIGSTFMIQVYTILTNDANTTAIFSLARSDVHDGQAKDFRKAMTCDTLNIYTLMVMARHPYSRLYSAYVDKVFILNTIALCKDILYKLFGKEERKRMCKFDITFEQFLEYYFEKGGSKMQSHYGPLLSNTLGRKLCNLQKIMIVKQETFSEDINQVLKSVSVKGREYDIIYDEMHSKQTSTTIASIVKTVYKKFSSVIKSDSCLSWKEMAKKLWKSFQIQGYINNSSDFPEKEYKKQKDYSSSEYLIQVIMKEVNRNPMTHKEKVRQRNNALLKAYENIDTKYIRMIQERYAMDFDMFSYSTDLKESFT